CRSGKISHMIACAIGMIGPPPSPWSTRIATRNSRFGAIPDRNELVANSTVQMRKKRRRPKRAESQPVAGMMMAFEARNDVTTHTGSLPRPEDLIRAMFAKEEGVPVDPAALGARIRTAVADVVSKQRSAGVDVVNDGEMSKPSYATYVKDRLTGFGGESHPLP